MEETEHNQTKLLWVIAYQRAMRTSDKVMLRLWGKMICFIVISMLQEHNYLKEGMLTISIWLSSREHGPQKIINKCEVI